MSDLIYRELMNDMRWSYTRIVSFEDCPYKWFLNYIRHEKPEQQFYSSFGSFIHKLLAQYYNGQITKSELPLRFLIDFKKEVQGELPSAQTVKKYIQQSKAYLDSFTDFKYDTVAVEERIDFEIDGVQFVCYIDFLGEKNGEYYIIDHKSKDMKPRSDKSNPTKSDIDLDNMSRQLYLYAAAVKQKYGKFPKELCFNCFRTGVFIKLGFDEQKYNETIQWALNTIEKIKDTSDFRPNREYFYCRYICGFNSGCCYWQDYCKKGKR